MLNRPHQLTNRPGKAVFRINLKAFFVVLTIVSVFLGIRFNQRSKILRASQQIEDLGGSVIPAWQKPQVIPRTELVSGPCIIDGQNLLKVKRYPFETCRVMRVGLGNDPPNLSPMSFFSGRNEDIAVSTVSINAHLVDEDTVSLLQKLNLKSIVLFVESDYLGMSLCERTPRAQRQNWMKELHGDTFWAFR